MDEVPLEGKTQFLENASLAFDVAGATKAYRDEIEELKTENDGLAKALGKATIKAEWAMGKLKSLVPQGHFLRAL